MRWRFAGEHIAMMPENILTASRHCIARKKPEISSDLYNSGMKTSWSALVPACYIVFWRLQPHTTSHQPVSHVELLLFADDNHLETHWARYSGCPTAPTTFSQARLGAQQRLVASCLQSFGHIGRQDVRCVPVSVKTATVSGLCQVSRRVYDMLSQVCMF